MTDGFMIMLMSGAIATVLVLVWCQCHVLDEELTQAALCSAMWMWLCWFVTYVVVMMAYDAGLITLW